MKENYLDRMITMLVAGLNDEQIIDYVSNREGWPQRRQELLTLLSAAKNKLQAEGRSDRSGELGVALRRLNDLYSRSLKAGDLAVALQTQKEINRLLDLTKVAHRRNVNADQEHELFFGE